MFINLVVPNYNMTYERIKIIKGREYRYLVRGIRDVNGKVKQRVVKYLGPVSPVNKTQRKKSTGRKPSAFVRGLTAEEKQQLDNATRSNNAFARDRARIILYSAEGIKVSEIYNRIQREKRSILEAIKSLNKKGLDCLKRGKTTGPKSKFTNEQKAKVIEIVNTDPRKLNKNFTTWSLPKIKQHLIENRIIDKISIETLRQIIKQGNKKYKKSRKWLYSNDPDFAKKN